MFLHEVTSGTCASNGLETIISNDVCALAAEYHGYSFNLTDVDYHWEPEKQLDGCFLHSWLDLPGFSIPMIPKVLDGRNNLLVLNKERTCVPTQQHDCECTRKTPCFCKSKFFVDRGPNHQSMRRKAQADGQFKVSWSLSLGGRESLLEDSEFLRFGFEQSVKDYINNDIRCSSNPALKGAEFFGVEILVDATSRRETRRRAVSGNGKCKGDVIKCKKGLKTKQSRSELLDSIETATSRIVKAQHDTDDYQFCVGFNKSTVFDSFKEKLVTASTFSYAVDVGTIKDLEGSLELKYDVSFTPDSSEGLDKVNDVDMGADEPAPIAPICSTKQCETQKDTMRHIFNHYTLPWEETKHECLYQGISCNDDDLITQFWMGKIYQYLEFIQLCILFLNIFILFSKSTIPKPTAKQ